MCRTIFLAMVHYGWVAASVQQDRRWRLSIIRHWFLFLLGPKERIAGGVNPRKGFDNNSQSPERAKESPPQADKKRERLQNIFRIILSFELLFI